MVVKPEQIGKPKRDTLGYDVPLTLMRLTLLSLEEIMEENAPPTLQMLGRSIGQAIQVTSLDEIPQALKDLKIGIIEIVQNTEDTITIRVRECVGCSGMKDYNESISRFERGLLAGVLEQATGSTVSIKESKCCTQGHGFCEFEAVLMK
jgi:predicted hydrocarbon binding protein